MCLVLVPDPGVHELDHFALPFAPFQDPSQTLAVITCSAVLALPGVDVASLSVLTTDGSISTLAPTDPLALEIDTIEAELGEGPLFVTDCAAPMAETCVAPQDRWPAYGTRVVELGVRGQLSVLLPLHGRRRATLNLYACESDSIDAPRELVDLFVTHSTLAINFAEAVQQLGEALRSRKVIGQALGIVMAQYGLSGDQAFGYLRRLSQDRNIKLRALCARLVCDFERAVEAGASKTAATGNSRNMGG